MAVRQYVGARYVPKFADPVAWQSGTSYEALTIVTYNNASYTSKIPVPATVGNPADNDEYWALTGNYNAQIEAYREEAVAVQENLNEEIQNRENAISEEATARNNQILNYSQKLITHRYFVFLGDSYSDPDYAGALSIVSRCTGYLNIPSSQYSNLAVSGAKLVSTDTNTFIHQIQNVTLPVDDNLVSDIILAGGTNDHNNTFGTNNTALSTLSTYLRNRFKNAHMWYFMVGFFNIYNTENLIRQNVVTAYNSATQGRVTSFPYVGLDLLDSRFINETGYHPNTTGADLLGLKMANALLYGNTDVFESWTTNSTNILLTFTPVNGITVVTQSVHSTPIINGNNTIHGTLNITADNMSIPNDTEVQLGTFSAFTGFPREIFIPVTALVTGNLGNIRPLNCFLILRGNTLYLKNYCGDTDATNTFSQLWLNFTATIDNH